jgi:hypothetical protein
MPIIMPLIKRAIIGLGYGTRYFQESPHPYIRARATLRYMPDSITELMPPILRDCLNKARGGFNTEVIDVYRDKIAERYNPPDFIKLRERLAAHAATLDYPGDWEILHLIKVLGLEKKDWPVV